MAFDPTSSNTSQNFNPTDPNHGGNADGKGFFGCRKVDDRNRIQAYWTDLAKNYGLNVLYYRHGYDLDEHDALYGEHTTAAFNDPVEVRALVNIDNQSAIMSQWGIVTDTDIQFYIPIPEFEEKFGYGIFPNRGDLIQIPDEACDRPEDQEPKVYQITDKRDSVEAVDLFAGHQVWFLEAKRFDYSWENNAPDEGGEPITDSTFVGIMEGGTQEESDAKTYGPSADSEAREDLDNENDSSAYGGYL